MTTATASTFVRTPHLERPDRVNISTLKYMSVSPKHYLHALDHPRPDTDALLLGRIFHCAVFEPTELDVRYVVSPRFNRAMNDETAKAKGLDGGKQAAALWEASIAGTEREIVPAEMMTKARAMCAAVKADPVSGPIVSSGWSERRIEWTDPHTGIECRSRVDHVNGILADAKSTRSIVAFERDVARFGYHGQLAFYYDGLQLAGIHTEDDPCLIAVESEPPYDVQVLTFNEEDLEVGRRVYRAALNRLAECRRTGQWPGVSGGTARRVVLPPWADPIMEDMEVIVDGEKVAL